MYKLLKTLALSLLALQSITLYAEEVTIATVHVPPYVIQHGDGSISGIAVDLTNSAAEQCGLTPKYQVMGWARALLMSERGGIDAIMPLAHAPGRMEKYEFPNTPLLDFEMTVFLRSQNDVGYDGTIKSLQGLNIGTLRSIIVSDEFSAAEKQGLFKRSKRDSYIALALSLDRHRIDAFIGEKRMGLRAISEMNLNGKLTPAAPPLGLLPVYVAFSQKSNKHAQVPNFDRCLQTVRSASTIDSLVKRYSKLHSLPTAGK